MGQSIGSHSVCHIDIITDDALIIIFSFLTLYDRLMVMRVSKRCHRILSNPQVWTHVDFWQKQSLTTKKKSRVGRHSKTWIFPNDKESVVDFLRKYTSGSLKAIYLKVVNNDILTHLKTHCGNLEIISFLSADEPTETAYNADIVVPYSSFYDIMMPWSRTVKVFEFSLFNLQISRQNIEWETLLNCFAKCTCLRCLTLESIKLTPECCIALSESKLTELRFLNVQVPPAGPRGTFHKSELNTAMMSLYNLTNMKSFRMSTVNPGTTEEYLNLHKFLSGIPDKWSNVRCLSLIGIQTLSSQPFARITMAVTQLETLELFGKMITDENIILIARYLKKLTTLKLTDGRYTPSGIGVLVGHPSIARLCLLQNNQIQPSPEWLLAVYDVICSLPKLTYVKLIGNRLIALHANEKIPKVTQNVHIEVENSVIRFPEEWWRDEEYRYDDDVYYD